MRQHLANRRGLALPFTIFLVTLITLLLAMAFSRTTVESQLAAGSEDAVTALAVAQGGLYAFLGDTFALRPLPGDSFRYNVVGGYVWIVPQEIRKPADTIANDIIYAVRSSAFVIDPVTGSVPQAERSIVQIVRWYTPSLPTVPALFTAPNGIERLAGGQFNVLAADQCGSGALPLVQVSATPPAVVLDTSSGLPAVFSGSAATILAASGVDWASVMSGTFSADFNSIQPFDTTYSIQMVIGNATLTMPQNGTGILIVTGNLLITGSGPQTDDVTWDGIILVGGVVHSVASYFDLNGIMVTGLNEAVSPFPAVGKDTLGGIGTVTNLNYDPCEVIKATARLRGFIPIPGTLIDNWAMY